MYVQDHMCIVLGKCRHFFHRNIPLVRYSWKLINWVFSHHHFTVSVYGDLWDSYVKLGIKSTVRGIQIQNWKCLGNTYRFYCRSEDYKTTFFNSVVCTLTVFFEPYVSIILFGAIFVWKNKTKNVLKFIFLNPAPKKK